MQVVLNSPVSSCQHVVVRSFGIVLVAYVIPFRYSRAVSVVHCGCYFDNGLQPVPSGSDFLVLDSVGGQDLAFPRLDAPMTAFHLGCVVWRFVEEKSILYGAHERGLVVLDLPRSSAPFSRWFYPQCSVAFQWHRLTRPRPPHLSCQAVEVLQLSHFPCLSNGRVPQTAGFHFFQAALNLRRLHGTHQTLKRIGGWRTQATFKQPEVPCTLISELAHVYVVLSAAEMGKERDRQQIRQQISAPPGNTGGLG